MTPEQRNILVAASGWIDTPYHHAARIKGEGVDCAQLLYAVFIDELKLVPAFDFDEYPGDWMMHRSEERFLAHVQASAREVSDPQPGDVVMFMWGRCFAHGAIVHQWPVVIHADITVGKVTMADVTQGKFKNRKVKFFRAWGEV
jgi:cell wall-associated NlpC family hydrolase